MLRHRYLLVSAVALAVGAFGATSIATAADSTNSNVPAAEQKTLRHEAPRRVDERIQELHDKLHITADQEGKWKTVADAMRETARDVRDTIEKQSDRTRNAAMTAVDEMRDHEQLTEAHYNGMKRILGPFEDLYKSMSPDQQKNADAVFEQPHPVQAARASSGSGSATRNGGSSR